MCVYIPYTHILDIAESIIILKLMGRFNGSINITWECLKPSSVNFKVELQF